MKCTMKNMRVIALFTSILLMLSFGYACDGGNSGCGAVDPVEGDYDTYGNGPYTTTEDYQSGPDGDSGLFYPNNGAGPFPILVFAAGSGISPSMMPDFGNHVASWGFIVMIEASTNSGTELTAAMDWLEGQNARARSVLYRKCDLSKIAAGGHSLGSIATFAIGDDPRLSTTIHVAGGSFNGNGSRSLRNPTAYICGGGDTNGTSNAQTDYRNTTVPVFMTIMDGVSHAASAQQGRPAIIAWLLWHLQGETERKAEFLNNNGEFQTGKWDSKSKNW